MDFRRAYRTDIQVRFSDTDALGHVNNVAFAVYLETARVQAISLLRADSIPFTTVVAHLDIDYRREIKLGQAVWVELLVSHIGRSSWTYSYRVLADGLLAAEANTVQVCVNPLLMRPEAIPDTVRAWLLSHADVPVAEVPAEAAPRLESPEVSG